MLRFLLEAEVVAARDQRRLGSREVEGSGWGEVGSRERQSLQIKGQAHRTSKKSRVVSAHICYRSEQKANTTGLGGQGHADRGQAEDSGALLNLGGRDLDGFCSGLRLIEGGEGGLLRWRSVVGRAFILEVRVGGRCGQGRAGQGVRH